MEAMRNSVVSSCVNHFLVLYVPEHFLLFDNYIANLSTVSLIFQLIAEQRFVEPK